MHFCFTAQYTPHALTAILDDPKINRYEATKKVIEAGGGKLISMYSTIGEGPGVLIIIDVPNPEVAYAITGIAFAAGTVNNPNSRDLMTQGRSRQSSSDCT